VDIDFVVVEEVQTVAIQGEEHNLFLLQKSNKKVVLE
jgi:hypothetical protein